MIASLSNVSTHTVILTMCDITCSYIIDNNFGHELHNKARLWKPVYKGIKVKESCTSYSFKYKRHFKSCTLPAYNKYKT